MKAVFLLICSSSVAFYSHAININLLRANGTLPKCFEHHLTLFDGSVRDNITRVCESPKFTSATIPYWNLYTVGWSTPFPGMSEGPGYSPWLISENEIHLNQSASAFWNDTSIAPEEDPAKHVTKQCALREIGFGFDWAGAGLAEITTSGRSTQEVALSDFKQIYFGAYMRTSANNVKSHCTGNLHNHVSLDFIYDYVVYDTVEKMEKVLVTNAIHLVVSEMGDTDHYGSRTDDILFSQCYTHEKYKTITCSTLVDAKKWGINTLGNISEVESKNVNADFLFLVKSLEGRRLLKIPDCSPGKRCTHGNTRLRHLQVINSVRSGARYVSVKTPFAFGVK